MKISTEQYVAVMSGVFSGHAVTMIFPDNQYSMLVTGFRRDGALTYLFGDIWDRTAFLEIHENGFVKVGFFQ